MNHTDILKFWFEEIDPKQWWRKDQAFDHQLLERFATVHQQAARCELFEWRATAAGRLAEIIVLDQFSRNMFRDTPAAFACDPLALALAQEAVRAQHDVSLTPNQRVFLCMPYMHSESLPIHDVAVALFQSIGIPENYNFELRHKAVIERFCRFPHRNAILGRASSAEEIEFLKSPGSSF